MCSMTITPCVGGTPQARAVSPTLDGDRSEGGPPVVLTISVTYNNNNKERSEAKLQNVNIC